MQVNHADNHGLEYQEDLPTILKSICLLLPPVGIIMYFFHKHQDEALQAKSALTYAIVGLGLNVFSVLIFG